MSDSISVSGNYKNMPVFINYFRLRPEFVFSLAWFMLLVCLVYTVVITPSSVDKSEFMDLGQFEMVELTIPVPEAAQPEIKINDKSEEEVKTKAANNMKFGNDSGKWDPSAMAATMPKPKTALPVFPDALKSQGVEGVVILEVGIDENGTVVYGKIVKSVHALLDKLVLDWARTAKFYPAIAPDGTAFKCRFFFTYEV